MFRAAHARRAAVPYWHLDETYLDLTRGRHELALEVARGSHYLTLVDSDGNTRKISFEVK